MSEPNQENRMRDAFDKARRAAEAQSLKRPEDWGRLREIERQAEHARATEKRLHRENYSDRVNREIKRLINERYKKNRDFKPRDVASGSDINRTAETNVRVRHQARLQRIDRAETAEKDRLRMRADLMQTRPPEARDHDRHR